MLLSSAKPDTYNEDNSDLDSGLYTSSQGRYLKNDFYTQHMDLFTRNEKLLKGDWLH